jgi:hypothetical protein
LKIGNRVTLITFLDWKVAIGTRHNTTNGISNCKLIGMFMSGNKQKEKVYVAQRMKSPDRGR